MPVKLLTMHPEQKKYVINTSLTPIGNSSAGVGLIEVLIAMLVMAVGILGFVGLQTTAKRTGYEAMQRSTAVYLINDVLERMRSNSPAVYGGNYSVSNLGNASRGNTAPGCLDTSSCLSSEIASYDLWEWEQRLDGAVEGGRGGLVSPRGCINVNDGFITVAIAWRGYSEGVDPNNAEDIDNCGAGLGIYDGSAADSLRQVVVSTSYINDN
ncbi:MAG: type IV pilus modification protein PilV [Gammaproteobacteria bacterium]|nr:MAG: type IV pilus modification protein PilV [Gammaproteobacteria bacterium]